LGKTRVVDDPRYYRTVLLHGGEHLLPHLLKHLLVVPRRVGHQVLQRLVHAPNLVRSQARRHRLDTLALSGHNSPVQ
jgi:hypothetical protein